MADLLGRRRDVLDLACGDGNNLPHLPAGTRYTGVDCSPIGVRRLLSRRDHPAMSKRGLVADVERLPLPDHAVDAVVSTFALEHFLNVPAILAECDRVLRPGGRLILIGPDFGLPNSFGPPQADALLGRRVPLLRYAAGRLLRRAADRLTGRSGFEYVTPRPLSDATYVPDADMTHLTDHREIARHLRPRGYRTVALETSARPPRWKRLTACLGLWGQSGDVLLCLEKSPSAPPTPLTPPRVRQQTIA